MASQLRFLTCGAVDDGKSTLLGRLLYDAGQVLEDQFTTLRADSARFGTNGRALDFALLVDGLEAEREQGITIDVAYRYFSTAKRSFVVADAPGHEQYTRNMATAASVSDLAVLLVDARKGITTQTRRHATIASLLGIRQLVLAVNKMDLVGFHEASFKSTVESAKAFSAGLGFAEIVAIPVVAPDGDNVGTRSGRMPWYRGPALLEHLEAVEVAAPAERAFRMPVQGVIRPNQDFRGYSGTALGRALNVGDDVVVLPSARRTRVSGLFDAGRPVLTCEPGSAVTVVLADAIDVSRGDVIASADAALEVADQFEGHVIWFAEAPLVPGRTYLLKCGTQTVSASVTSLVGRLSVDSHELLASRTLSANDIGICRFVTAQPLVFAPYASDRNLGAFILIDPQSFDTLAAGLVRHAMRRATNVHVQRLDVPREARAGQKLQRPRCIWFTGLSGSGKSTIANSLDRQLLSQGRHTYVLDGDNLRHGLNRDLGFTEADRVENVRRTAEVAKLMVEAGLIVLVCLISPFRRDREAARALFAQGEFIEVHVDTPLDVCEQRDPKGLYRKARAGSIPNFTGISAPYEPPTAPEVRLLPVENDPDASAALILRVLS